jgi:hypothetical protein
MGWYFATHGACHPLTTARDPNNASPVSACEHDQTFSVFLAGGMWRAASAAGRRHGDAAGRPYGDILRQGSDAAYWPKGQ